MIEMVVEGIGIDPQNNPLVLLRDEARSTFVPIGSACRKRFRFNPKLTSALPSGR